MDKKKIQIHATNINGLGASQVVISFLEASSSLGFLQNTTVFLPSDSFNFNAENTKIRIYKRFLPNPISRFVECFFSSFIFSNVPTIVLGDIPLRGIHNQVVLVHQPNLVYPKINKFSGKSLKFRINRFLFSINQVYAKKIIVQTGAIAEEMIKSYPAIKDKVVVIPQPVPNWLDKNKTAISVKESKIKLFYPSAFYPHKKHEFLLKINEYLCKENIQDYDFEIWLTLKEEEFQSFKHVGFLKNLGQLSTSEMNDYYKKADALLFISSMESYGLPLIESLTIDLPIIVADFNYSRWMCENSAYYFDPYDEKSLLKAIYDFTNDYRLGHKVNYIKVLEKFPDNWEDVANSFNHLLLNK
ncbi:glycosyltransferase [Flavobacterium sp. ST-87]|uniref:Glycosyltransferase n=1 Tax=Flavobacterium plantiphilum TaxID=3163297 RepID=A0ABW8XWA8_9FLAO